MLTQKEVINNYICNIMGLIYFILITTGIVNILIKSSLFKPTREFISSVYFSYKDEGNKIGERIMWFIDSLFSCPTCMGFWVGMLVYTIYFDAQYSMQTVFFGAIGSLASKIIISYLEILNKR